MGCDPVATERQDGDTETAAEEEGEEEVCDEGDEGFEEEGEGGDAGCVVPEEVVFATGRRWGVSAEVGSHVNFSCVCCVPD